MAMRRWFKCSHLAVSLLHVFSATRFGAITGTGPSSIKSWRNLVEARLVWLRSFLCRVNPCPIGARKREFLIIQSMPACLMRIGREVHVITSLRRACSAACSSWLAYTRKFGAVVAFIPIDVVDYLLRARAVYRAFARRRLGVRVYHKVCGRFYLRPYRLGHFRCASRSRFGFPVRITLRLSLS